MNGLLNAALRYASIGWHVFPVAPGQKVPLTSHGVKDATVDTAQIEAWWRKWPNANVAVACGRQSGVYVIDVDIEEASGVNGVKSLNEFPSLPKTVRQKTPRGGFHAFYRTDNPPANKNSFRHGIDIRGDGYYVLLEPSVHPNGRTYCWALGMSPWDIELAEYPDFMRPSTTVQAPPPVAPVPSAFPVDGSRDNLEVASRYVIECDPAVQGQGGHDKLLWAAGCMTWGCMLSEEQAFQILAAEYNPRCVPPWDLGQPKDLKDFRRKITESIRKPPQKPRGWIINDPAYAQPACVSIDLTSLLESAEKPDSSLILPPDEICDTGELEYLCAPTGLLGLLCGWINSTAIREQPFLTLGCAISFLGALFGRKVEDEFGGRTNVYCMGVAPSSAGKNHALSQVRLLCHEAGCTNLLGGDSLASDSGIEGRMAREPATLFLWDEIGHLLMSVKSGANQNCAQVVSLLMRLYSAAGSIYLGREYADAENQRKIVQPCCCVYGTSTQERFVGSISPQELQDGWLSRCLVFFSNEIPVKQRGRKKSEIPREIVELVTAWHIRELQQPTDGKDVSQFVTGSHEPIERPSPIVVPTRPEAERLFIEFDNESAEFGRKSEGLQQLWAKAEENARRFALIHAAGVSFESPAIGPQSADFACRLTRRLLLDFSSVIAPEITDSWLERAKRKIVAKVRSAGKGGCIKREITRASQWTDDNTRRKIIADLIEAEEIVGRTDIGGKTIRYWTVDNFRLFIESGGRVL